MSDATPDSSDRHLAKAAIVGPLSGSALDASWAVRAQLVNVPFLSDVESRPYEKRGVGQARRPAQGLWFLDGV